MTISLAPPRLGVQLGRWTGCLIPRSRSDPEGVPVLVLGLTHREGMKELAYSRALPLIERLASAGARVSAWDPLLAPEEVERCGAAPWDWGTPSDAHAIDLQTADPAFRGLDLAWFSSLEVLLDGRNGLRDVACPGDVLAIGVRVPPGGGLRSGSATAADAGTTGLGSLP